MFSGSYESDDVTFLLKRVSMAATPREEKERLIQTGVCHYSELLADERAPSPTLMTLFEGALERNGRRVAADVQQLAADLIDRRGRDVSLVSLARAGTPIGILLRRALLRHGVRASHHSISVIRGRGVDTCALDHIRDGADDSNLVFVDGWTAKGGILNELEASVTRYNASRGAFVRPDLVTLSDLSGRASLAATTEDYLIPSAVLNATVSGLVSRTILNHAVIGPDDFHGCVMFDALEAWDQSRRFVDDVTAYFGDPMPVAPRQRSREGTGPTELARWLKRLGVDDPHLFKPGVGEATRALTRRVPEMLITRDTSDPDVAHLLHLASSFGIVPVVEPSLPYLAAAVIRPMG